MPADFTASRRVLLLGWPLGHSISPAFQNAAFAARGLPLQYALYPVAPANLAAAVMKLREDLLCQGANVTVPHKEAIVPFIDALSPTARRVGAVNTLRRTPIAGHPSHRALLYGDNTDVAGLALALQELGVSLAGRKVVVLGAGGAARAALWTLLEGQVGEIAVYNRTRERAVALVTHVQETAQADGFGGTSLRVVGAAEARQLTAEADLVLNTTSAGLDGHTLPLDDLPVRAGSWWYDLVYNPPLTPFLAHGQAGGAHVAGGLGMLIHQGAAAFELWTAQPAPLTIMRAAGEDAMLRRLTQGSTSTSDALTGISLVGQSGSGKSSVAQLLAARWGGQAVDIDARIVASTGREIATIFATEGETAFRDRETTALREALTSGVFGGTTKIVATGGGIVLRPENRMALQAAGPVVWLRSTVESLAQRLETASHGEERPLLSGNIHQQLDRQLQQRHNLYATMATLIVDTDSRTVDQVADEIDRQLGPLMAIPPHQHGDILVKVPNEPTFYPVQIGWGTSDRLGDVVRTLRPRGRAFIIADMPIATLYGDRLRAILEQAGVSAVMQTIPAGEQYKTLDQVAELYSWLAAQRVERTDVIIAAGGGRTGDLVGFVAATMLRGIGLIQIPTTLLAMIDSSLGGKVGVDLAEGKNLVGAFHHPLHILADLDYLRSLPARELSAGLAEVIKHAMIADGTLLTLLEARLDDLLALDPQATEQVVRQAMLVKINVVQEDPLETGRRAILNYGHSIGHAIESAAHYRGILHGEAVAFGMSAAAHISVMRGLLEPAVATRQDTLLRRAGLLGLLPPVDLQDVLDGMTRDKKVQAGRLRWILLEGIGQPRITTDVPLDLVDETVRHLLSVGPHWPSNQPVV